jgi:hypothetical protein
LGTTRATTIRLTNVDEVKVQVTLVVLVAAASGERADVGRLRVGRRVPT